MIKTVADQFAEILAAAGIKRIYGIVGVTVTVCVMHDGDSLLNSAVPRFSLDIPDPETAALP
jgi:hypothetical protein